MRGLGEPIQRVVLVRRDDGLCCAGDRAGHRLLQAVPVGVVLIRGVVAQRSVSFVRRPDASYA